MLETIVLCLSLRDVTDIGYDMTWHAAFHKACHIVPERLTIWYHFIPRVRAKNYQNRGSADKVIAKV